jgi:Arc/MetJ-type ribon-helix-helix transcriptional regulator
MKEKHQYTSVSLSGRLVEEIDRVIEELGFWPSRSTFVREACLEKIKRERQDAKANRRERKQNEKQEKGGE